MCISAVRTHFFSAVSHLENSLSCFDVYQFDFIKTVIYKNVYKV
jgi:hypothetical protein